MCEKIPYLKSLGITAIELLPVQAFATSQSSGHVDPSAERRDYWGYNPIALFAPHWAYGPERNGEQNLDGLNENYSANYGVEGPTSDPAVNNLRFRHMKNVLATLLLASDVPMLLGGDAFGRTQLGNNNAYCQDNEVSWYDWTTAEENASLVRFVQRVIALRQAYAVLRAERFYSPQEIKWMGPFGQLPEWQGAHNRIGCVIRSDASLFALLFNATTEPCEFALPDKRGSVWRVCIDTSRASPDDAPDEFSAPQVRDTVAMHAAPQSVLTLQTISRG